MTMNSPFEAYILVGCTAVGKTAVANELARRTGAIVLSADSMLVYRGMDIGTAKPTAAECEGVDLRGADLACPGESFSVAKWLDSAKAVFREARAAGRSVIVAGGTGLYVNALLAGIDSPEADPVRRAELMRILDEQGCEALKAIAERLQPGSTQLVESVNPRRVLRLVEKLEAGQRQQNASRAMSRTEQVVVGLQLERPLLVKRIEQRARGMFEGGLLEEAKALRQNYPDFYEGPSRGGIGYAEAFAVLDGEMTLDQAVERTSIRTRQLAKRQNTWWKMQLSVDWVPAPMDPGDIARAADDVLKAWEKHGPTTLALGVEE